MSIWYRTGTVTVTNGSKNVVGVDTTFNTSIYPGDLFTVDENVFYEVADVTSNLNFTLQRNYAGTTRSGEAYVVVPLSPKRQLTAELAARVNILIERYRGAIEAWTAGGWAVDTNGDYKVSGDTDRKLVPITNDGGGLGTATKRWGQVHANSVTIAGQAVVPKTASTANATPVAGSDGKLADGWIPATVFNKSNILGTVSQVGGVPTGAVIESGTNANGTYVKFADGTFLCEHTVNLTGLSVPAASSVYVDTYWTLPVTATGGVFVKTIVNATLLDSNADDLYGVLSFFDNVVLVYNTGGLGKNITPGRAVAETGSSVCNSAVIKLFAYGRWY